MPCLASGTPLVYSGSGEGARLVSEADAGIVVDPEDGAAIAGAVERLLADPGLVRRLGENGRRLAVERFSWRALVGAWLEQLDDVLPPRSPPHVRALLVGLSAWQRRASGRRRS